MFFELEENLNVEQEVLKKSRFKRQYKTIARKENVKNNCIAINKNWRE